MEKSTSKKNTKNNRARITIVLTVETVDGVRAVIFDEEYHSLKIPFHDYRTEKDLRKKNPLLSIKKCFDLAWHQANQNTPGHEFTSAYEHIVAASGYQPVEISRRTQFSAKERIHKGCVWHVHTSEQALRAFATDLPVLYKMVAYRLISEEEALHPDTFFCEKEREVVLKALEFAQTHQTKKELALSA